MSSDPRSPVIVAAHRTPIGTAGHAMARLDLVQLLAPVLERAAGVVGDIPVEEVIVGNCLGPGGNPARVATLQAGLGVCVPAVTVDRQCGSGQEAVHQAGDRIRCGAEVVLAGGVESASTAPWRMWRPISPTEAPQPYSRAPFAPAAFGDPDMGPAAEALARRCRISRARQDEYAARSHELHRAAAAAGQFEAELVPVGGVDRDERPRALTSATLGRLRPVFEPGGSVTAGNCCGISDGAAVLTVVSERVRSRAVMPGLRIVGAQAAGVDPRLPGLGPVPAVRRLLHLQGLELSQVGAIEITEAFAAQVLACTDDWGLDPLGVDSARVCSQGGAIALGHPWGASGALLLVRLFSRMVRQDGPRWGLATCAIGGGQGLAVLVERVGP